MRIAAMLSVLVLGGCCSTYEAAPPSAAHPASADAQAAPARPDSGTLDLRQAEPIPPATTPAPHAGHEMKGPEDTPHPPAAAVYTCPMHPEVTSDRPGRCPKCGMALVKKGGER